MYQQQLTWLCIRYLAHRFTRMVISLPYLTVKWIALVIIVTLLGAITIVSYLLCTPFLVYSSLKKNIKNGAILNQYGNS